MKYKLSKLWFIREKQIEYLNFLAIQHPEFMLLGEKSPTVHKQIQRDSLVWAWSIVHKYYIDSIKTILSDFIRYLKSK